MIYTVSKKIIDTVIVFLLILSTGGMLFVLNRNLASITFLALILIALIFFGNQFKKNIFNASILTIITISLLGCVNYFFAISEQSLNKYAFHFLTLIISTFFLIHFLNNRNQSILVERIYFVLKIIAIHAFFSFILYFFVQNNLTDIVSKEKDVYKTFQFLFYYMPERSIVNLFNFEFCRNQGLFWEPGILQVYLNMLFFLEAFVLKRNKSFLLLSSILIFTTYSTTGLLLLSLQLIIYFRSLLVRHKILIPIALIAVFPLYLVFNENITEKFQGERESSFQKRMFDFTQPLFIAWDYPLTGIGLDLLQFQNMRQEYYLSSNSLQTVNNTLGVQAKFETTEKGSSNSITFLLACTGFPTTILLLYMLIKQNIIIQNKWLWFGIMIMSIISEPLLLRPFFFFFIVSGFMGFSYRILNYKKNST